MDTPLTAPEDVAGDLSNTPRIELVCRLALVSPEPGAEPQLLIHIQAANLTPDGPQPVPPIIVMDSLMKCANWASSQVVAGMIVPKKVAPDLVEVRGGQVVRKG